MGLFDKIKRIFNRGKYFMTTQNLAKITDHPKIAVSLDEYNRIANNLKYYSGKFKQVTFVNSNNEKVKREFNHLPIARTACKKIASLVYNEQAEIVVDDNSANTFIQDVLKNDRFNKNFERYLESCLALGGLAMRPYYDGKSIRISFVQAPVFMPLQTNTQDVSSAAIITRSTKAFGQQTKYYTLIEIHEWSDNEYVITNELYKSDYDHIVGARVDLSEVYENLDDEVRIANLSRPLFTYLKTPGMNNKDINSPLGLSIFDNAKTTIDFINRTYDEFMWEVKMGQRRVAVPEQTLKTIINYKNEKELVRREFDPNQNVFISFDSGGDNPIAITDLTTPIRADDYIKAINEGLSLFEMQIGVSQGLFTFDGKSMKTATEVVSENSDTYQMRNSIVSLVEQSIKELVVSICELGAYYQIYSGPIPSLDSVTVNLDDGVFTDKNALLDFWTKAYTAKLSSQKNAIMKAFGVTEEEAQKMVDEIQEETIGSVQRSPEDVGIYGE